MGFSKKVLVILLGFVFSVLLIEVILRLFTLYYLRDTQNNYLRQVDEKSHSVKIYNILMLGNSHTEGVGIDKKDAYSGVLQRFFDKNIKNSKIKVNVINEGRANANTYQIYKSLNAHFEKYKPNLTLIMAGQPNVWNKDGYSEFGKLKRQKNEGDFQRILINLSNYSKIIKWLITFDEYNKNRNFNSIGNEEEIVYKELAFYEEYLNYKPNVNDQDIFKKKEAFEKYITRNRSNPNPLNWRPTLFILSKMNMHAFNNIKYSLDLIEESINYRNEFDLTSYLILQEFIQANKNLDPANLRRAKKLLIKNTSMPNFPEDKKLKALLKFMIASVRTPKLLDNQSVYELAKLAVDLMPIHTRSAQELINSYLSKGLKNEANNTAIRAVQANPFSSLASLRDVVIKLAYAEHKDLESKNKSMRLIEEFNLKFPGESYLFDKKMKENLHDWIYWDLSRIAEFFQSKNSQLVILNYHWLRFDSSESLFNDANKSMAENKNLPFIDIRSVFIDYIEKNPETDKYYTKKFGDEDDHPSELGHKVIAYAIYTQLVNQNLLPEEISHFDAKEILY